MDNMNLADALDNWPGGGGGGGQKQQQQSGWPGQAPANPVWPGGQSGGGPGAAFLGPGGPPGGGPGGWPCPGGQPGGGPGGWPSPGGQPGGGPGGWPSPGGQSGGGPGGWPSPGGQPGGGPGGWPCPGGQSGGGPGGWPSPGGQPGGGPGGWPSPGGQPKPNAPSWPGSGPAAQQSLAVPYQQTLRTGVYDKLQITIAGTIKPHADKITVDLKKGDDLAFHFNPRFNEDGRKVIVRNSCIRKKWGPEERELRSFPFVQGQPFEIKIACTKREFRVTVNNSPLLTYKHRITELESINDLRIYNDLTLSKVHMETLP